MEIKHSLRASKKWLIYFLLIFLNGFCLGQQKDSLLENFSKNWKSDSQGENGFRKKCITRDSVLTIINGINITGYSKEKVIKLLGKPNRTEGESISYYVAYCCPDKKKQKLDRMVVRFFKNKVTQVQEIWVELY